MANNALEHFITQVQNMSSSGSFHQLAEVARRAATDVLVKNQQHLDNVLQTLDLQQHSIGILAILHAKFSTITSANGFEGLFAQIDEFVKNCNGEQIRSVPDIYVDLCHRLTEWLIRRKEGARGIQLMSKAIERLQAAPSQLTSVHQDLCLLCLQSRILKPALPFLDIDIVDIAKESQNTVFDSRYFLLYYYYGGMIYAALKKFDRALYFFEVAVTTPCTAVSSIMVESYKKYVLAALIHRGKVPNLPKYTSSVVNRFIKPMCTPYLDLCQAYSSNSPDNLREMMNKHLNVFTVDQNLGLVKQVVTSLYKRSILRLTKTFLTLSLTDVANRCHLSGSLEAEKYILSMIDDGEIFATINQKDGMVYFEDNPEKYCTPDVMEKLEKQLEGCIDLDNFIKKRDTEQLLNPQYIHKITKTGSGAASSFSFHDDEGVSVGSGSTPKELSDLLGMS